MAKNLRKFLKTETWRDDPVGDLAKDVELDPNFPTGKKSFEVYERYMRKTGACWGALVAMAEAYLETPFD